MRPTFVFCLACAVLLGLAACGSTYHTTGVGSSGDATATTSVSSSPQPVSTEPLNTVGPTATTAATATAGGTVTPGSVTIRLSGAQIAPGAAITFTILNGLTTVIKVADHQTNCATVTLQQQAASGWTSQAPCRNMSATRLMELAPGSATAGSLGTGNSMTASAWATGTYRIQLTYFPGSDTQSSTPVVVYSATFTVG